MNKQTDKFEGKQSPMRILCLDGGGMKGVYACSYLATLETYFKINLTDHFDLIAGTSTGGIIALGIASRMSACDILNLYKVNGREIFPNMFGPCKLLRRLRFGHAYHHRGLNRVVGETFRKPDSNEPLRMKDAATRLCIPAVNARDCSPRIFKAHQGEEQVKRLTRDTEITMAEVALATAAAPWYFPIAHVKEAEARFTYLDGGLWANNPSVIAITEALTNYVGDEREFDRIQLLSVGLPGSAGFRNDGKYLRGMKLIDQLLTYAMESSNTGVHNTAKFLLSDQRHEYVRIQPDALNEVQSNRLRLDAATRDAIDELTMLGKGKAEHDKNLAEVKSIFT